MNQIIKPQAHHPGPLGQFIRYNINQNNIKKIHLSGATKHPNQGRKSTTSTHLYTPVIHPTKDFSGRQLLGEIQTHTSCQHILGENQHNNFINLEIVAREN